MADRTPLKLEVSITEINQKVEPRTGNQINLRSGGAKGKKIFKFKTLKVCRY
jgi:hypothetical protein